MNRLKQHLNDSLQELELTPAMEAEILMNAEKPAQKVRFRSRAMVAALLVVCMVSITAVAAVMSTGWQQNPVIFETREERIARLQKTGMLPDSVSLEDISGAYQVEFTNEQPQHAPLSDKAITELENFPTFTIEEEIFAVNYYPSLTEVEEHLGFSLLSADGFSTLEDKGVRIEISQPAAPELELSMGYRLYSEKGDASIRFMPRLSTKAQPNPRTASLSLTESPTIFQYEIESLGVTADVVLENRNFPADVFLTYENISYILSISIPQNISNRALYVCDLLETLHD